MFRAGNIGAGILPCGAGLPPPSTALQDGQRDRDPLGPRSHGLLPVCRGSRGWEQAPRHKCITLCLSCLSHPSLVIFQYVDEYPLVLLIVPLTTPGVPTSTPVMPPIYFRCAPLWWAVLAAVAVQPRRAGYPLSR
jgi:hypothetical protein